MSLAAAVDKETFVPAAKKMVEELLAAVKPRGVGPQQPFRARDQVGFRNFDDQMKMVAHEAPGMNQPVGFAAALAEGFNEGFATL